MTFDTLAVATELKQAGFSQEQAEALARAWSHVASGDLAAKSDVVAVRTELVQAEFRLKEEIASLRSELKADIAATKADIADVRKELVQVEARLEGKIADVRSEVKTLRWMIGFALGLLVLILGKLFVLHP
ncbi:MAG: uncharacterized protein C75L2_00340002 [Leptospirillum sp. Group II 'C75']|jgi:septal ring factor EnvC (AmiA/AmiB activator)|uniref:coiled-coil domain-containing protein n=1 Tax=Leptospirillum sp. Group II 'CF-1' TaxID=1660083 RepID=UPI0000F0CACD|nr:coiled-coil domain-containing protein [Leptospirillum sp. Group II 'CF-1']EAY56428.1 MAG: conserved protein of unknown function [Leptospirillum rubarum]EIJ75059.1 MAG: uncharacterized protein C75L2_00340002 [Leptospirillum sp. Group II 'C75']